MIKFWRKVRIYAEEKCKKHVNCDIKCPNCNTWASSIEGECTRQTYLGYVFKCGQCGEENEWLSAIAPVPLLASNYPDLKEKTNAE